MERKLEWEFTFGKYKGCTVEEVIRADVSYMTWAIENIDFKLDNKAFSLYCRKKEDNDTFPSKRR